MNPVYRGRFAPTPSGPLHFGSLIAALGSYLEARTCGGQWWLRIDDLDPPRVQPGAADDILRTLDAYGFEWDGRAVFQSHRLAAYHAALHRLRTRKLVYPCACSRAQIASHGRHGPEGTIYPDTCRQGMPAGTRARSWRLQCLDTPSEFDDAVQGPQEIDLHLQYGDFPLYRADGVFSFHLASAVDDILMGVTHIVRGSDLLASSLRQAYLHQLFGAGTLAYAHLPVVVDSHGEKFSKQTHAEPLDIAHANRELVRALAFLGQVPPADLARAPLDEIWGWAFTHWRLDQVPRVLQRPESAISLANAAKSSGSV